jgi:hypothetical protein
MTIAPAFVADTMCQGMYYPEEFVNMEIEILRTLSWRLNGPTPLDFIQHFICLLPLATDNAVVKMVVKDANKMVEFVMTDYNTVMESYWSIALASIQLSIAQNMESVRSFGLIDVQAWMSTISHAMTDA